MSNKVLVACVGNIFLGDDAFGVEVARQLSLAPVPASVTVTDFGIRSYDLAYALMDDWQFVILVDAVSRGGTPGTVYVIEPDMKAATEQPGGNGFDAHTMNPVSVIQMVQALAGRCPRMILVGCEPETIEPRADGEFKLSEPIRAAVTEAVRTVQQILNGESRVTAA